MNYIDQGDALTRKVTNRKLSKKNSLFYQQSVQENEEFLQKYEKNVDQLQTVIEEPELKDIIQNRNERFFQLLEQILRVETSIKEFSKGYEKYGFLINDNGLTYREWAPNAKSLQINEFSCTTDNGGNWEVFIPKDDDDKHQIQHNSALITHCDEFERASVWATATKQNNAIFWNPENKYEFNLQQIQKRNGLRICKQSIENLNALESYNAILIVGQTLMALNLEQTNPEQLKKSIDQVHSKNQLVLLEIDHQTIAQKLKNWDGSEFQYLKDGQLDYGKWEVLRLLLSNLAFWINEYKIDGFLFSNIDLINDLDAAVYVMLGNDLIHDLNPQIISIASKIDYPHLCRGIKLGGIGFDFKLTQLQQQQYLPKTIVDATGFNDLDLLKSLSLGQGVISDTLNNNKLLLLEQQLNWLDNEFAEIEVINGVHIIKRSQLVFLINETQDNKVIELNQPIKQVLNKDGVVVEQVDENKWKIIVNAEDALIVA